MSKCLRSGTGKHCDCEYATRDKVCCYCYEKLVDQLEVEKLEFKQMANYAFANSKPQWISWDVETTKFSTLANVGYEETFKWAQSLTPKEKKEPAPPVEDSCEDDGSLENVD